MHDEGVLFLWVWACPDELIEADAEVSITPVLYVFWGWHGVVFFMDHHHEIIAQCMHFVERNWFLIRCGGAHGVSFVWGYILS